MEINILFPRNREEADYLVQIACAGRKSTRSNESTTQILTKEKNWLMNCCCVSYKQTGCKLEGRNCPNYNFCCERIIRETKSQKHWGVLEFSEMIVDITGISRACSHQLVRHRLVSYLQQSQREVRISVDNDDWYVIPETILSNTILTDQFKGSMEAFAKEYEFYLKSFPKEKDRHKIEEDARFVLPNACKTNILVKTNVRQWLHIYKMRLDSHAQWEIRKMAQIILEKSMKLYPLLFEGAGELDV